MDVDGDGDVVVDAGGAGVVVEVADAGSNQQEAKLSITWWWWLNTICYVYTALSVSPTHQHWVASCLPDASPTAHEPPGWSRPHQVCARWLQVQPHQAAAASESCHRQKWRLRCISLC